MEATLEQSLAAAVYYIQSHTAEETALYFDRMPESYKVPSIYFPVPWTTSRKATFHSYLTKIHMEAWFMASEDWLAYSAAADVRDSILLDNCLIGIMEETGTDSGRSIRVDGVELRSAGTGTVRLSFSLDNYFSRKVAAEATVSSMEISCLRKSDLYGAWLTATKEQRKEEEENGICLKEALKSL